ncbi:MAG: TPM domain-containing protein [Candidatus Eisenbacteria bacterium]|nr:TPM domain-containing protein [Candidatus Eisenbacteria bacterium]
MGTNKRNFGARLATVFVVGMFLSAGVGFGAAHAQAFHLGGLSIPSPTGYVNDFAGVLRTQDKQTLESFLSQLDQKTGAQFALVIIPSLEGENRDDVAVRLFETWKIGRTDNRGALLLDAINDRSMRVEVGYGLEGILPDGLVGQLRDDYFTRPFRDRRQISPEERFQAYLGMMASMAQIVAKEQGIDIKTLTGEPISTQRPGKSKRGGWLPLVIFIIIYMAIFRKNPMLGMILLMGMAGGGGRGRGGSGGFGGFGGGFGGFGGGMSGGGGAGGRY